MGSVSEIPDAELIRRVIEDAATNRRGGKRQPLWATVSDRFCLGSTYSGQLCRRFGYDPDQESRR